MKSSRKIPESEQCYPGGDPTLTPKTGEAAKKPQPNSFALPIAIPDTKCYIRVGQVAVADRAARQMLGERRTMNATVNAGIYCRLSVEDENVSESESIQTQKAILTEYCDKHGFHIVDYYVDDGRTGTNFQRPEFQRMLEDIEAGKVNTVLCKDLSRFGRNYYEAGRYLDDYFVEKGVRFIAPGNNVDSAKGEYDLTVPFINMMNDYYARDISAKTRAAKEARAKQGMYMGSKAPYGYVKDPEDKHKLIEDPEAAEVVRRMFNMAADGNGYNHIARTLQQEGVLNPYSYEAQRNPNYLKGRKLTVDCRWHVTSVKSILTNPVYLGQCIACRRGSRKMHGKKLYRPEEDWIVVQGTHTPLISQEEWDQAQERLGARKRKCKTGEPQMFAGLLRCSDCGNALSFSAIKGDPGNGVFKCWYYMRYGKEYCTTHYITLKELTAVVLQDIRYQARFADHFRDTYVAELAAAQARKSAADMEAQKAAEEADACRLAQLDVITKKLLEQNALGAISDSQFVSLSQEYDRERREIEERQTACREEREALQEAIRNADQFADLIRSYTELDHLDRRILNRLIDKIVIHQRQRTEDGRRTQTVEIHYRFVGRIGIGMPPEVREIA